MTNVNETTTDKSQYSLLKILGIWLAAALPMGVLVWVILPRFTPDVGSDPLGAGVARIVLISLGLIWQFLLSLIILWREEGDIHWGTMKRRFRLNTPRDPNSGEPRRKLWLWLIPIILLLFFLSFLLSPILDRGWVAVLPFFTPPEGSDFGAILTDPAISEKLIGAWWFLALFLVMGLFNIFGEEFIFRGVLLPKMNGVFGRWDWVANGFLMGAYHWHQPWMILGGIVVAAFCFALPAKRFRSTWMGLIPHSIQIPFQAFLILGIILGLS